MYFSAADDADMDGKHWIGCDGCAKWNHTDCELKSGNNKEYREAAEVSQRQLALEIANEQKAAAALNQNPAASSHASADKADVEMQDGDQAKGVTEAKKQQESADDAELPYFCLACRKTKGAQNPKRAS